VLSRLLRKFEFVRELESRCASNSKGWSDAVAQGCSLGAQLQESEERVAELQHCLDIERVKRISAEQISVSRGNELDWLRDQYSEALKSRDAAISERVQSLDLVNVTLLKQQEAEAPPTKDQMAAWQPVLKSKQQAVPLMRKAEHQMIKGLQAKSRRINQPPISDKVV